MSEKERLLIEIELLNKVVNELRVLISFYDEVPPLDQ